MLASTRNIAIGLIAMLSATPPATAALDEDLIIEMLTVTNLSSAAFPWIHDANARAFDNRLKRWDFATALIPVQTNGNASAELALDRIERALGLSLFDRTSLIGIPVENITRGLIVSTGTAYVPPGTAPSAAWQAGVSAGPFLPSYPANFVDSAGAISTRLFINLGNSAVPVPVVEVVEHEFAHALGFGAHFPGFGQDDPLDPEGEGAMGPSAYAALATLYHNAIGARAADITAFPAAPIPEPDLFVLMAGGLGLVLLAARRRQQSAKA